MTTDLQADVYAAVTHFVRAADALGNSTDGRAAVARMKALPTEDSILGRGTIRADGRRVSPVYVFNVKPPAESRGRYDVYRLEREVPVEEAYRPVEQGGAPSSAADECWSDEAAVAGGGRPPCGRSLAQNATDAHRRRRTERTRELRGTEAPRGPPQSGPSFPSSVALGPVDVQRDAMTAAARWMVAA